MKSLRLIALIAVLSTTAFAQQTQKPFEPVSGQAGKDVVWVPTSMALVDLMMKVATVTKDDFVMDLGSGDGRNIIAAAKLGANGLGVEFNPDMVALSRKLAAEAGVADTARFVEADMYEADISKASVLALFLLPVNMNRLAPKFFNLAPGSRIVANTFGIDGWQPDARATVNPDTDCESWCEALLWIVPAKVHGTWEWPGGSLVLEQSYQVVTGTVRTGDGAVRIAQGKMRGDEISFIAGGLAYTGTVKGNVMEGTATTPSGTTTWRATRRP
ncbi:MAG: class I SAM-dependent methyltransferase [Acidobacteriota bacterium]|nr:class I SAM-dependent methyltransferase [Acidobacteriota bacterium]